MNVANLLPGFVTACRQILRRSRSDRENSTVAAFDPLQISTANANPRSAGKPANTRAPRPAESFETTLTEASLPALQPRPRAIAAPETPVTANDPAPPRGRELANADARVANPRESDERLLAARRDERDPPAPSQRSANAAKDDKTFDNQTAQRDRDAGRPDDALSIDQTVTAPASNPPALDSGAAIASAALGSDQTSNAGATLATDADTQATTTAVDAATQAQAAAAATALTGNAQTIAVSPPASPAETTGTIGKIEAAGGKATLTLPDTVPQSAVTKPEDVAVTLPSADSEEAKPASAKSATGSADIPIAPPAQPPLSGGIDPAIANADRTGAAQAKAAPISAQPKAETALAVPAAPLADEAAAAPAAPAGNTTITQAPVTLQQPTPVPTLTPTDTAQVVRDNVPLNRLGIEIATTARAGVKEIEVRLDPPELGRIDVRLDIDDSGQVNTHLVVERASTLDQLRRDAPNLERLLNQSGLKADSGSLQFSLRDQNQPYRQQGGDGRRSRRGILAVDGIAGVAGAGPSVQAAYAAPLRQGIDVRL